MPESILQAYAIKKPSFTFSIQDLMFVKDNPGYRLTATPFVHNAEDKVFLGHSVPWKGVAGINAVRAKNVRVAEGLERAIGISRECAGVTGTVAIGGRLLPKKVICEMEHGHGRKAAPA